MKLHVIKKKCSLLYLISHESPFFKSVERKPIFMVELLKTILLSSFNLLASETLANTIFRNGVAANGMVLSAVGHRRWEDSNPQPSRSNVITLPTWHKIRNDRTFYGAPVYTRWSKHPAAIFAYPTSRRAQLSGWIGLATNSSCCNNDALDFFSVFQGEGQAGSYGSDLFFLTSRVMLLLRFIK